MGTAARVILGLFLFADGVTAGQLAVIHGQLRPGFDALALAVGLVVFPAVLLAAQRLWARRTQGRLEATGPVGMVLNMAVFLALFLTPWYARPLAFTSDAALVFYGASMLLAALRGYAGCEVLAISNWIQARDDQVGCLVLGPLDRWESHRRARPDTLRSRQET